MKYSALKSLAIAVILLWSGPSLAALDDQDIQQAARRYCQALDQKKSVAEAQEIATDYLTDQMGKNDKPNYKTIRQQMRQSVLKICPQYADLIRQSSKSP